MQKQHTSNKGMQFWNTLNKWRIYSLMYKGLILQGLFTINQMS
jgi:hypothetical protein